MEETAFSIKHYKLSTKASYRLANFYFISANRNQLIKERYKVVINVIYFNADGVYLVIYYAVHPGCDESRKVTQPFISMLIPSLQE